MDIAGDDTGVWMTYDELAVARDIKRDGARRLAQRHHWRRHPGNDGLARVLVPREWLPNVEGGSDNPRDATRDDPGDVPRDTTEPIPTVAASHVMPVAPDVTGVVTALQGAIDTLRQQLVRADARIDELRVERDQARDEAQQSKEEAETRNKAYGAALEQAERVNAALASLEADLRVKDSEIAEQRLQAEQARIETQAAKEAARRAESAAEALRQVEETKKGRGRWARLRAAWRGA